MIFSEQFGVWGNVGMWLAELLVVAVCCEVFRAVVAPRLRAYRQRRQRKAS